jgi:hypothetical protein
MWDVQVVVFMMMTGRSGLSWLMVAVAVSQLLTRRVQKQKLIHI